MQEFDRAVLKSILANLTPPLPSGRRRLLTTDLRSQAPRTAVGERGGPDNNSTFMGSKGTQIFLPNYMITANFTVKMSPHIPPHFGKMDSLPKQVRKVNIFQIINLINTMALRSKFSLDFRVNRFVAVTQDIGQTALAKVKIVDFPVLALQDMVLVLPEVEVVTFKIYSGQLVAGVVVVVRPIRLMSHITNPGTHKVPHSSNSSSHRISRLL